MRMYLHVLFWRYLVCILTNNRGSLLSFALSCYQGQCALYLRLINHQDLCVCPLKSSRVTWYDYEWSANYLCGFTNQTAVYREWLKNTYLRKLTKILHIVTLWYPCHITTPILDCLLWRIIVTICSSYHKFIPCGILLPRLFIK